MPVPLRHFFSITLLIGALLTGCQAGPGRHAQQPAPAYDPTRSAADTTAIKPESVAHLVGQVLPDLEASPAGQPSATARKKVRIRFEVKETLLLERFIRAFGDGTVVDRVLISPIQDEPRVPPTYYLIGTGQLNGQYRAMALPLYASQEKALYLKPDADRHIAAGFSCPMCYFEFSRGQVTGVDCDETNGSSAGRRCTYRIEPGNQFFTHK